MLPTSNLHLYVLQGDADKVLNLLSRLSCSEFRRASKLLGDTFLAEIDSETFWHLFAEIVPKDTRAYLGTFLKAAVTMLRQGRLNLEDARLAAFCKEQSTDIDCRKIRDALLPMCNTPEQGSYLLSTCGTTDIDGIAVILCRANTPVCDYLLFQYLRHQDHQAPVIRQSAIAAMRRGCHRSFNLACIISQYFDLPDLPGKFSLKLEPYELSCLENGYTAFRTILDK